jgi:hypothetical protein
VADLVVAEVQLGLGGLHPERLSRHPASLHLEDLNQLLCDQPPSFGLRRHSVDLRDDPSFVDPHHDVAAVVLEEHCGTALSMLRRYFVDDLSSLFPDFPDSPLTGEPMLSYFVVCGINVSRQVLSSGVAADHQLLLVGDLTHVPTERDEV